MSAYKPPPVSDRIYQLRIFIQIAETGSFVGAARALQIPPATVSAAIRMLESELDEMDHLLKSDEQTTTGRLHIGVHSALA